MFAGEGKKPGLERKGVEFWATFPFLHFGVFGRRPESDNRRYVGGIAFRYQTL